MALQFLAAIAFHDRPVPRGEFAYGEQTPLPFFGPPDHSAPKRKDACSEWISY